MTVCFKRTFFALSSIILLSPHAFADHSKHLAQPPYIISPSTHLSHTGLSPAQVAKAYGFDQIASQGEGQIIAIIDAFDHPNIESDLAVFSTTFDLPPCTTENGCFRKVYARDTPPPVDAGWALEIALDVEWAHAVAPKAQILLVEAADNSLDELAQAARVAVREGATVASLSWGTPEFSDEAQYDRTFNVPNVTFTAASGDSGSRTIYPAASPYVLAVGGTSLFLDENGNYVGERAWRGSGGGLSRYEPELDNQRLFPVPNNITGTRAIPDVAYNANPYTGYSVYDSVPIDGANGWYVVGGTSAGAPQWAAIIALANIKVGEGLNINTVLYRIGQAASYNANFHDIIWGRNGRCGYFCRTRAGYDYVTGLGSPKLPTLVNTIYQYYLAAEEERKAKAKAKA